MILDKLAGKKTYNEDVVSEKPIRSVAKALSWRLVGTIDTMLVSYLVIGKLDVASLIASVDFVTKMVLYFFHERIWNSVKWGK